jgi:hypothetical protein
MMGEAERWNAMMRERSPEGFELDEEHAPHVTLIQRFIAKSDLPKVLAAVDKVKSKIDMNSLEMTATGLYHIPTGENGLAGIVIEPTEQLHALQQALIEAVNVYARKGGSESASPRSASNVGGSVLKKVTTTSFLGSSSQMYQKGPFAETRR